jgi:tripartite-type tricarboxylate transporter receptor subunit TctC
MMRASANRIAFGALVLLAVTASLPAFAQKLPSRPIRIMLPFAAGSVSDVTVRILADKLSQRLGISVLVDNQPRAGGISAVTTTLTSPPDGTTLVVLSSSTAISVSLLKSLPYDPVKDFIPVSGISTFANIIATNAGSRFESLNALLADARAHPGKLNIGTTTVGSTNHLAANLLRSTAQVDFVIVPFRTPGELITGALRNDVDAIIQSFGALKSAIEGKQLRALAGTTGTRAPYAPTVPTVDEAGMKGFEVVTWNGFFAVNGTPPKLVDLLNREIRATLDDPELRSRFLDLGLEPLPGTPAELRDRLVREIGKWAKVIADAGIEQQ